MASELKQKTVKGLAWNTIQNFSNRGVQFLLMLFMARLLSPKEYGIVGLTAVFTAIASIFVDCGFANALIRKKDCTNNDYSTVFIFNLFISCLCYIIIFIIAPFAGDFYKEPILCPILRVIALQLIIYAFCTIQSVILTKNIDFKKKAKISVTKNIISGFVGLLFAFWGYGVWALVIQQLTASILNTIMLWSTTEWYPNLHFSKKSFNELFGYSSKLLITNLIHESFAQLYPIVIGKFFSPATLGNYSRAHHWGDLGSKNITGILHGVTFPVLAKIQDDDNRLADIYRRMIRTSCFIIFPIMMGMSAIAYPLTLVVIGEKWIFSAYLLQILCFSLMWNPVTVLNLNLLQIKGRSDLFLRLEIIKKIISISVLCISIPMGIVAMCYLLIISTIIALIINTYYTGKLINVGFLKQMRDIAPTLILSLVMFAVVFTSIHFITNIYIQLVVGIIIGTIIYIGGSYIFKFQELNEVLVMYKDFKNRNK